MNYQIIIFTVLIVLLVLVFLRYNILTSSPELLDAAQYKNTPVIVKTQQIIQNIVSKAYADIVELFESQESPTTIKLFYKLNCPHCHNFYPVWKRVIEMLPDSSIASEYECSKDSGSCRKYKIESVPAIIITANGVDTVINGELSVEALTKKMSALGMSLNKPNFEGFVNYITAAQVEAEGSSMKSDDPDCPYMSFFTGDNKYHYCASSNYLNGCLNASPGSGINAFDGAFGVITSYLNSLPVANIEKKKKCLSKHVDVVKSWNLCNSLQLAAKRGYSNDVEMKRATPTFLNVNYNDNKDAVDAINYACGLSNV